jgi:hypothetical protein
VSIKYFIEEIIIGETMARRAVKAVLGYVSKNFRGKKKKSDAGVKIDSSQKKSFQNRKLNFAKPNFFGRSKNLNFCFVDFAVA